MIRKLALFSSFGLFAFAMAGCTATTDDNSDGGPTEDSGVPPEDTGTPTDGATNPDVYWTPPPDPSAYYVRFVVATSDFTTGTPYDVCYLPWDGTTPASATDVYTGPIAAAFSSHFSAPEVSEYFQLDGLDSGHETVRIRLVAAGGDCTQASKFSIDVGGTTHVVSVEDDPATFSAGYNTAIVYGNVDDSTGYQLLSMHDADPSAPPDVPTLQFFNGYSGDLSITLTATDGTSYTLSSGPVPFKAYLSLPFTTSTPASGVISIANVTFDPGGGATPISIGLSDYSFDIGYYWAFSYGNTTDGLNFYLCGDSLKVASDGDVAVSGCLLKP